MFILVVMLAGAAVAVILRRLRTAPGALAGGADAPARLLGWAVGLLAAERAEWGQAMLGELDHVAGRARRWRFAAGCVAAAMILPPWGRAALAAGSLAAVAVAGFGLFGYASLHYGLRLGAGAWLGAAVLFAILAGYLLGAGALLRRPGVAGPGLAGGLLLAAAWLAASGWTFDGFLAPTGTGAVAVLLIAVPAMIGAAGTLWGGSAAAGRRAARLAAVSAGLGLYLFGVLAVAAVGLGGQPGMPGMTAAGSIADQLGNQAGFALVLLPLATATVGWAGAAATARLRWGQAETAPAHPAPGLAAAATAAPWPRSRYLLLLSVTVAAAVILAFVSWLPGR